MREGRAYNKPFACLHQAVSDATMAGLAIGCVALQSLDMSGCVRVSDLGMKANELSSYYVAASVSLIKGQCQ